jgi:hypothetical protein
MSPELERLLNALWERDFCEPKERAKWKATVERLIADARSRRPGLSREQFMDAVIPRYEEFRRARRKPTTLPPKA